MAAAAAGNLSVLTPAVRLVVEAVQGLEVLPVDPAAAVAPRVETFGRAEARAGQEEEEVVVVEKEEEEEEEEEEMVVVVVEQEQEQEEKKHTFLSSFLTSVLCCTTGHRALLHAPDVGVCVCVCVCVCACVSYILLCF